MLRSEDFVNAPFHSMTQLAATTAAKAVTRHPRSPVQAQDSGVVADLSVRAVTLSVVIPSLSG